MSSFFFQRKRTGFTLIELLIAIGIIAVLATVAIVAINPPRQFAKANDTTRQHDLTQIVNAIQQNIIDNRGPFSCAVIPACDPITGEGTIMGSGVGQYDICPCLVSTYLPVMPVDPQFGSYTDCTNYDTQYEICTSSLVLRAPHAQLTSDITTTLEGDLTVISPTSDFSITPNPSSDSIAQGNSASPDITVTSFAGFNDLVTFSTSVFPPEPTINTSFTPTNSCTPPSNSTCFSTMQVTTDPTTPATTYTITITGVDGGLTRQTNYGLTVFTVPNFSFSAVPSTIKAPQTGTSQTSTITILSLNGFNSAVTLSVLSGLPAGATENFTPNPVTPPSDSTITSDFTVDTTNVVPGIYPLTIQAQSGALIKTTNVTLEVVDLSVALSAIPSSGDAPLNNVDLTATVSGTATGTINYKFDCTDDGVWELEVNNSSLNPFTAVDLCNYATAGNYTVRVYVERDVASPAQDTTAITVNPSFPCFAPAQYTVFVTSASSGGNLGGTIGADSTCNTLASTAGLSGSYTAWVSASTSDEPRDRGLADCVAAGINSASWYLPDGTTKIVDNWVDLTDGTIDNPINIDENNNSVSSSTVWTATGPSGNSAGRNCSNWTSTSTARRGMTGGTSQTDGAWTYYGGLGELCNGGKKIYCFQDSE